MSDFEKALVEFFKDNNQFTVYTVVYKVVQKSYVNGRCTSYLNILIDLGLALEYAIGKKTIPKVGKIFVFEDYHSALCFGGGNTIIFYGYATNVSPIKKNYVISLHSIKSKKAVKNYWENSTKNPPIKTWMVIQGTRVCDSFTPSHFVYRKRR